LCSVSFAPYTSVIADRCCAAWIVCVILSCTLWVFQLILVARAELEPTLRIMAKPFP
jgi:hypothetical protein